VLCLPAQGFHHQIEYGNVICMTVTGKGLVGNRGNFDAEVIREMCRSPQLSGTENPVTSNTRQEGAWIRFSRLQDLVKPVSLQSIVDNGGTEIRRIGKTGVEVPQLIRVRLPPVNNPGFHTFEPFV
jgi:hypothetical protein